VASTLRKSLRAHDKYKHKLVSFVLNAGQAAAPLWNKYTLSCPNGPMPYLM
jgi:hypothetical protein